MNRSRTVAAIFFTLTSSIYGMAQHMAVEKHGAMGPVEEVAPCMVTAEHRLLSIHASNCSAHTLHEWIQGLSPEQGAQIGSFFAVHIEPTDLIEIAKRCPNLVQLDLLQCSNIGDEVIQEVVQSCPGLTHLGLPNTKLSSLGFRAIAKDCPNLVWLDLHHSSITDEDVQKIAERCRKLVWLDLSGTNITDYAMIAIVKSLGIQKIVEHRHARTWASVHPVSVVTEKCHLTHIYLENCCKITNLGLWLRAALMRRNADWTEPLVFVITYATAQA